MKAPLSGVEMISVRLSFILHPSAFILSLGDERRAEAEQSPVGLKLYLAYV
jgi:hypothetical protein